MVVVPEPAVKGCGALGAVSVDRTVGPAAEKGPDEAFSLAVGYRCRLRLILLVGSERFG
jgi:hypothetical protein